MVRLRNPWGEWARREFQARSFTAPGEEWLVRDNATIGCSVLSCINADFRKRIGFSMMNSRAEIHESHYFLRRNLTSVVNFLLPNCKKRTSPPCSTRRPWRSRRRRATSGSPSRTSSAASAAWTSHLLDFENSARYISSNAVQCHYEYLVAKRRHPVITCSRNLRKQDYLRRSSMVVQKLLQLA